MKNLIISFILIFVMFNSYSQKYYWNGSEKVFLEDDFSSIVVYEKEIKVSINKNHYNVNKIYDYSDKNNGNYKIIELNNDNKDISFFTISNIKDYTYALKKISYNTDNKVWLSHDILLKIENNTNITDFNYLFSKYKAQIIGKEFGNYRIRVSNLKNVLNLANTIYETGKVKWCQPDFLIITHLDDDWEKQYYLHNVSHDYCGFNNDINAFEAWKITKGCNNITVAVIDDGVENHPDLYDNNGNSRVLAGYTPSGVTQNGRPDEGDKHGQACAGIIAASHSSEIRGIAPNINILPVKLRFGSGIPASEYSDAINWAWENNADILSNSWGGGNEQIVKDAIENAKIYGRGGNIENNIPGLGAIVIFSSGNEGKNHVSAYASISIAVGAIDKYDTPGKGIYDWINDECLVDERYTNIGPNQDLVAYGGSANEDCVSDIRTIDRTGNNGYSVNNYYNGFGGTSAACPQVSGVAALILSINPNLTRTEVENILFSTATDLGVSGRDDTYGYGKINAFDAIKQAINSLNQAPFYVSTGYLPFEKINEDTKVLFGNLQICYGIAEAYYYCDIYKAETSIPNTNDWFWYIGDGMSGANPNYGSFFINETIENGEINLFTFFYFIKYDLAGNEINKWVPNNPNSSWTRKYLIAPQKNINFNGIVRSGETLNLRATESIVLEPGFETEVGATFTAEIVAGSDNINCLPNPAKNICLKQLNDTIFPNYNDTTKSLIDNNLSVSEIIVYPNPCKGNFYIEIPDAIYKNASLEIFSLNGQKIFETTIFENNQNIIFTNKQGVYILNLINGTNIYTEKIILK